MPAPSESAAPIGHILVCGNGLAAQMTLAMLARHLPAAMRLSQVVPPDPGSGDLFYGNVTAPSAYAFNLAAGVDEPSLMLGSDTGFSWGTRYAGWGGRTWTQCFTLPLPVVDGVLLHQYLAAIGSDRIDRFLAGAQAAKRNAFAHPPRGAGDAGKHPLARADYGYQIDPVSYAQRFAAAIPPGRVTVIEGGIAEVTTGSGGIEVLRLDDGRTLTADLYVDCTGPEAALLARLEPDIVGGRRITLTVQDSAGGRVAPLRTVTATEHGWTSDTPLAGRTRRLTTGDADEPTDGPGDQATATLGRRAEAWAGNCVGIGHAAGVVEPITPAPIMLLERDIERLLALIPNAGDMGVERREYNRRFDDDFTHAALFNRALFAIDGLPDTPYWRAAQGDAVPDKLVRKIAMFTARGLLVAYDLEPFHPEDWTILHLGLGHRPARHDRLADRADTPRVRQFLDAMQRDVEQAVAPLPAADLYRTQLVQYLQRGRR
jgi:tryptophan halogenase